MKKTFAIAAALAAILAPPMASAAPASPAPPQAPKAAAPAKPAAPGQPERVSHGRFKDVALYRPRGEVKEFVLFLSGDGGWKLGVLNMARALVDEGAMVAGINVPALYKNLAADGAGCIYPDGDLENLSHFLQGYARLDSYHLPIVVGYSSGATLAYAVVAQAPVGTFAGAVSLGFCPDIDLAKPMCIGEALKYDKKADGKGFLLRPTGKLGSPWVALQGGIDQECPAGPTHDFVAKVPDAQLVMLPKVGHGYSVEKNWMPQFLAAYRQIAQARAAAAPPPPPASLSDLPVNEVPAEGKGDLFAVLISGDGGWAGLDRNVAAALAAKGVPVAGVDSLRYFWSPRTPEGLAADLDRIVRYYAAHWSRPRVVLVGYSQGADVLSFAVNRLPAETQARLARAVMIAPGEKASFEFHVGNWLPGASGDKPILPEAQRLDAATTLCLYGADEKDSLCPQIAGTHAKSEALPGGHHFNGAYDELAARILAGL